MMGDQEKAPSTVVSELMAELLAPLVWPDMERLGLLSMC